MRIIMHYYRETLQINENVGSGGLFVVVVVFFTFSATINLPHLSTERS